MQYVLSHSFLFGCACAPVPLQLHALPVTTAKLTKLGARKLACSKEPDGCGRCKRENIQCFYSPQKPMGRPRKRRAADTELSTSSGKKKASRSRKNSSVTSSSSPEPAAPVFASFDSLPFSTNAYVEPALAFIEETQSPNMHLLQTAPDFYQGSCAELDIGAAYSQAMVQPISYSMAPPPATAMEITESFFLDSTYPSVFEDSNPPPLSYGSHASDSPSICNSPPAHSTITPRQPAPNVSCGCLSSLYFALETLASLPKDIPSAMRVARAASKIAHEVVACNTCSGFVRDVGEAIPVQSFQNFTFLGSLVPSACNAYATIVEMVHQESTRAKQENRTLRFSYWQLGGQWPHALEDDPALSINVRAYDNKDLHPDIWRQLMCSIMRLDVFGKDGVPHTNADATLARASGLKGLIAYLDQRSDERHIMMDERSANGQMIGHTNMLMCPVTYNSAPKEDRHCVRTLHLARVALDSIVIG